MTGKSKKKKVDFTVRPKLTKENLPPTPDQWIEEGQAADAPPPAQPIDVRPENAADVPSEKAADAPTEKEEKRLTLNLPAGLHTAFKGQCVFEGITIQDKVRWLIERELTQGQRIIGDKPGLP